MFRVSFTQSELTCCCSRLDFCLLFFPAGWSRVVLKRVGGRKGFHCVVIRNEILINENGVNDSMGERRENVRQVRVKEGKLHENKRECEANQQLTLSRKKSCVDKFQVF